MSDRPGAAVIGTGFGCRVHVPALRNAGIDVVALVGRDAARTARRAKRLGIGHALTSLDDALALEEVEAVTIATPPSTHAPLAIAAVGAGKHVICEKPFSMNAAEAEVMLDAAESAGVTHLVGHEFRWATERAVAGRALASGRIGEPRMAMFFHVLPLVADPDARMSRWWFDEESGGGWLGASGSHVVDQIRVWLGEFETVSAALTLLSARESGSEDSFTIRFRLVSGADGVLQQSAGAWGPMVNITRIAGSTGTLWLDGESVRVADASGVHVLAVPDDLALPPPPDESDDPRHRFTHLELGPYTRLCEILRTGIEGRVSSAPVPIPTFADGLASMRVLDAVRESAARGGAVMRVEPVTSLAHSDHGAPSLLPGRDAVERGASRASRGE